MDSEETLKYLQQKYPEDLNENYRCYWWCTSNIDGSALTYYLVLHDRTDPLYAKNLTREELDALTNQKYFNEEELRYYFDLLVSRYCLTDKEYNIEESESEEDIDEAIDELKHEINELKEIQ